MFSTRSGWRALGLALLCAVLLMPSGSALAQTTLVVGSTQIGSAGGSVTLNITLTNAADPDITQLQFDLQLPTGATFNAAAEGQSSTAASKTLTTSDITGGKRFLLFALNTNTLANGVVATVTLDIAANQTSDLTIGITNVQASNVSAQAVTVQGTAGTISPIQAPTASLAYTGGTTNVALNAGSTFTVTATFDSAVTAATIAFSGTGQLAGGAMTISGDGLTGTFSATAAQSDSGTYTATISSATKQGETFTNITPANNSFSLTVTGPPSLTAVTVTPSTTATPGPVVIAATFSGTVGGTVVASFAQGSTAVSNGNGTAPSNLILTDPDNDNVFTGTLNAVNANNGTYTVSISGATSAAGTVEQDDTATLTINIPANLPAADVSRTVGTQQPGVLILDGSASANAKSQQWALLSAPDGITGSHGNSSNTTSGDVLRNGDQLQATFLARTAGTYQFQLSVGDESTLANSNNVSRATASITVPDLAPVATVSPVSITVRRSAGADVTKALDASRSFDPNDESSSPTFAWSLSGAGLTLSSTNTARTTVTVTAGTTNITDGQVTLTVSDATSNSTTRAIPVKAFAQTPPVANAGFDRFISTSGTSVSVTLFGRDSADPSNTATNPLSFSWSQVGGALTSTQKDPVFTLAAPTTVGQVNTFTFQLTVTSSSSGLTDQDRVTVKVKKIGTTGTAPEARFQVTRSDGGTVTDTSGSTIGGIIKADIQVADANSIPALILNGTASGSSNTFEWTLLGNIASSGASTNATLTAPNASTTQFAATALGTYRVLLRVTDPASGRSGVREGRFSIRANPAPAITDVVTTIDGNAASANTTTLAAVTTGNVSMNVTASNAVSFTLAQLTQSKVRAELEAQTGSSDLAAQLAALFTGSTVPDLADFETDLTSTTGAFTFNLKPLGGLSSEITGGSYFFRVTATSAEGVSTARVVNVPVNAGGRVPALPQAEGFTLKETEEGLVLDATGAELIDASGTLTVSVADWVDRASGSSFAGVFNATGSTAFVQWTFLNGDLDLTDAAATANAANSGRGSLTLTQTGVTGTPSFRVKVIVDNGAQQQTATINSGATGQAAAPQQQTIGGGGGICAAGGAQTLTASASDLVLLMLPLVLLLGYRLSLRDEQ